MPLPKGYLHLIFGLEICFLLVTYIYTESSLDIARTLNHRQTEVVLTGKLLFLLKFPDNSSCILCLRVEMFYCLMPVSTVQCHTGSLCSLFFLFIS